MEYTFIPKGVCSQRMDITLEDGVVKELKVTGGCHGNLRGSTAGVRGPPAPTSSPGPSGRRWTRNKAGKWKTKRDGSGEPSLFYA